MGIVWGMEYGAWRGVACNAEGAAVRFRIGAAYDALSCIWPLRVNEGEAAPLQSDRTLRGP